MNIEIDFPEVLVVSHSRIKAWRRCQMQHHYRYYQGLKRVKKGTALFTGSAVHSMIEEFHEVGNWQASLKTIQTSFKQLFREEQAELGDLPGNLNKIVSSYFDRYSDDGLVYPKRRRGKATEIKVLVDLDSKTQFLGYIDAFPKDSRGRNWVMDHKTCKSIPEEETRFADLQLLTYVWLLPQLGYPMPDGLIWDYIRTKAPVEPELLKNGTISRNKNTDTTPEVYLATVEDKLGEVTDEDRAFAEASFGSNRESFYRRIYLPTPNQKMVESVVKDLTTTTAEIRFLGPKATVRNMTRDCKMCSYYNLCQAEVRGLDSEYIRQTEYTTSSQRK